MNDTPSHVGRQASSRRAFLKKSSIAVAGGLGITRSAHAAGSDVVRMALIGCGGRGAGAAVNALQNAANPNVKLVAMADPFADRMEGCLERIAKRCKEGVEVPREQMFAGFDGYKKAIACDVDLVLLCTPPGFRPMHFEAAVAAGKHVFMEKPVAVDSPGVRRVLAANKRAKQKGLAVAVGLNMRHTDGPREVVRRIHDGVLGRLAMLRVYCNNAGVWVRPREPGQTEMEYQMRNWYYFNWLSGDHIVEQHVHLLDLANWMMKDEHPIEANGMGGRQVRVGPDYGEIFDHHAVEFTYADGTKMFSFCRHMPNCWRFSGGFAHGTKGTAGSSRAGYTIDLRGKEPTDFEPGEDGHQVEHDDLFAALLAGKPYNEGDYGAIATMTAILGRMATYSGEVVTWDDGFNSELDLSPERYTFDANAPIEPGEDGLYPCPMPGLTKAW